MRTVLGRIAATAVIACASVLTSCDGCNNSNVEGNTYLGGGGAITLEFKSGGKATLTFMGQAGACTYTQNAKQVSLTCPPDKDATVFTVNDDGTLSPPPGSMLPPLTKKK